MSTLKHHSPRVKLFALCMLGVSSLASGAEAPALVDRVPMLAESAEEVRNDFDQLEAAAAALQLELEAAETEVQERQDAASTEIEAQIDRQTQNFENATGLSFEDLEAMDDDEAEAAMLGAFGINMEDLDTMENMDDDELAAFFSEQDIDTGALQDVTSAAPAVSDPVLFARLSQEYGDWSAQNASRSMNEAGQFSAMREQWDQQHAALDSRLDADLVPRLASIPVVDCGEEGDFPDAIAVHAIQLERSGAHADLVAQQLREGIDHLASRRDQVKADAIFAQRFADESRNIVELSVQATSVEQQVLQHITELLEQTMETARTAKYWVDARTDLENSRPAGQCG